MRSTVRTSLATMLLAAWPLTGLADESKTEKMTSDQTQQQYQRKSITYLGFSKDRGVSIRRTELRLVEGIVRRKIEMPRFDYNQIDLGEVYTVEEFVAELRNYIKERAVDRASAEAEYEARFKRARVMAQDIDRIMSSAYFYSIKVHQYKNRRAKCPENKLEALGLGCTPEADGMMASLNTSVTFYRVNLMDETQPPYQLLKRVGHAPVKAFTELPAELPPEERAGAEKRARRAALNTAAVMLAEFLSKGVKQIPDFKLLSPVTAVLGDGVEFMLGRQQGVGLDDTYDVAEYNASGKKSLLGYVKVRQVGTAQGTGEGAPSYAENVKVKQRFVGGEQLFEHPMIGLSLSVAFVMEFVTQDVITAPENEEKFGLYPGVGIYIDKDIANLVGVPELYISIEGDILFVPNDTEEVDSYLAHGMIGVKKKWYLESLVFSLGVRGGVSYYIIDDYEDDVLGFGGDLWAGVEYYLAPEFSIYLKAAGRYFSNPLSYDSVDEFDPELGVNASVGAFLAF